MHSTGKTVYRDLQSAQLKHVPAESNGECCKSVYTYFPLMEKIFVCALKRFQGQWQNLIKLTTCSKTEKYVAYAI